MAFKAGNKKDPDYSTFMKAMIGEYGEEYRDEIRVEMQALL